MVTIADIVDSSKPSRPVILVLSAARGHGGGERSLEQLLVALARDYHVFLLVENIRHAVRCREILGLASSAQIVPLPLAPKWVQILYGAAWTVYKVLRCRPVFVLANNNKSGLMLALASRFVPSLAARAILYVRDFQWRMLAFIVHSIRGGVILIPSAAVTEKEGYLAPLLKEKNAPRCAVVQNVVADFSTRGASSHNKSGPVVMLGTIQRWKGQEYIIRALTRLPPEIRVKFYGDVHESDYFADVQALAVELGVAERVEFHGHRDDVGELLRGALCVAVTSVSHAGGPETFSRVVIEAWAARTPIVAFDAGGPRHLITHDQTGLLVEEGNWQGLALAVERLARDRELVDRLLAEGYRLARTQYDLETVYAIFQRTLNA